MRPLNANSYMKQKLYVKRPVKKMTGFPFFEKEGNLSRTSVATIFGKVGLGSPGCGNYKWWF